MDFTEVTTAVYELLTSLPRCDHLTSRKSLPASGIYVFYERDELTPDSRDRIVRVGTHNRDGRFPSRIRSHYGSSRSWRGNKNASVFRKHVGSALLRRDDPSDHRLTEWERSMGETYPEVEEAVSRYMREAFTFVCFPVSSMLERLALERGLIALLAQHPLGNSSARWLGHHAGTREVRASGLWNVQKVNDEPLTGAELEVLRVTVRDALQGLA